MQLDTGVGPVGGDLRARLERTIVPLVVSEGEELTGIGSASLISHSGVVLMARHVVEEAHARGRDRVGADGVPYRHYDLQALIRTGEANTDPPDTELGGLLPVTTLWGDDNYDVMFGLLRVPVRVSDGEPLALPHTGLNLTLPRVGQRVVAFGYQGVHGTIRGNEIDYEEELFSSDGVVTKVFHERRDSVMLKFPSFHVEGDFRPGMSGGPIFLEGTPGVPAIVCSGSHGGYASGAMVWPGMGIPRVRWGAQEFPDMLTVARKGFIAVHDGLDRVDVQHFSDGRTNTSYTWKEG